MTMTSTLAGTVLGVKPRSGGTGIARWFRIITDREAYDAGVLEIGVTENEYKCRDTMGCGGDDAPSIWGIWTDVNLTECTQDDQEATPTLVYFPYAYVNCIESTGDVDNCVRSNWIGKLVQAFYSEHGSRWETDTRKSFDFDQMDFVYLCEPRDSLIVCGTGSCPKNCDEDPPPEDCPEDLSKGLFDGSVRRDKESCDYTCGPRNATFDVWVSCTDIASLPIQDCYPARRVSDAHTLTYCPFGIDGGPMITETRPVYSIGCCGCGCPQDEMYLEFWAAVDGEMIECENNGQRITVPLSTVPLDDPEGDCVGAGKCCFGRKYEGYFCLSYRIPRFLVLLTQNELPEMDLHAVEMDCVTGELSSVWQDHAINNPGCGGGCYVAVEDPGAAPNMANGVFDVLKQFESCDGIDEVCTDLWTTCKFCYKVTACCNESGDVSVWLELCLPPGNPAYAGGPLADPNAEPVGLIPTSDMQTLTPTGVKCSGREWYTMGPVFGVSNPMDLLDPETTTAYGFPAIMNHVFGGCCWDHVSLGAVPPGVQNNTCTCCYEDAPSIAACQTSEIGSLCSPQYYVKVGWNCANDI
jgi:hypothetical protein